MTALTSCSTTQTRASTPAASSLPPPALLVLAGGSTLPPAVKVDAPGLRTDTRPLPYDAAQIRTISAARISPDGSRIAYVVRIPVFDPKATPKDGDTQAGWKVEQQLFVVDRAGGTPRQLTFGEQTVSQPAWSPDGQIVSFMRTRNGKGTLHLLPMSGGEARTLDLGELEPAVYEWSPDGASIAFLTAQPLDAEAKAAKWRSGGAIQVDEEWPQLGLYVVPAAGGEARRITGDPATTGSIVGFHWSPDGKRLAVTTAESSDPYHLWSLHRLQILSAADGSVVRTLETTPATIGQMAWSPNGRYLAYERGEDTLSLLNVLRVREVDGQGSWNAAARLDPTLAGFVWSRDSRSLVAHVLERTASKLYRVAFDGRTAQDLGRMDRVLFTPLDVDRSGRYVVAVSSTANTPPSVTAIDVQTMKVQISADVNPQVAEWTLGKTEIVRWKNPEGVEIEGLLTVTPHARAGTPPPLLILPHGGPDSVSSNSFSSWVHYFAARGYSVLRPNYRGGFGYGRAFYEANRGRLGEIELMDIESGVDALIAAGKADADRLFYGGWSWGGYITAWTITKTKRYRAAVVGAGVVDVVTQYVTSDINHGHVADWEFKGRPWQSTESFERSNPARSLGSVVTPTLIIHGQNDDRVAFVNGQILYRGLKDTGCEVKFLAYPREPHGFREPAHIAHMLEAWARWYDSHQPS